jgi:hypothetical protein
MTNPNRPGLPSLFSALVRGERARAEPEPAPVWGDEYLRFCAVCNCTTVWRAVAVAGRHVSVCLRCAEQGK